MVSATVTGIGSATPPALGQREMWDEWFAERSRGIVGARKIWHLAGVEHRHAAVDPRVDDTSLWTTGARMARYLEEAVPLATTAAERALSAAHRRAEDVDLLVAVSCTGYATPGVDLLVARELDMSPALQRLFVGHMGCHAALPALAAASDAVVARGLTALVVCVEVTSVHLQPPCREVGQLVSHALFSDAAAAMVVEPGGTGWRVIDVACRTDAEHEAAMTWRITDLGFRMGLASCVPDVLARHVRPMVDALLRDNALEVGDVAGWAIHPGGPQILHVCARTLGLDDAQMAASVGTLRDHGNCSSSTVVLVLERLLAEGRVAPGGHAVALAFGPGLTLHAVLLERT